jgi:integrase
VGSIVKESLDRSGKKVTRYRAHVRRAGFQSQSKRFETMAEAKAWLRNAEADAAQRRQEADGVYSFAKVADLFAKAPARRGTKFWSPTHLAYWVEQFGPREMKSITRADINVALASLQEKKADRRTFEGEVKHTDKTISSATVNRYLASLSSMCNYALNVGHIDRHPLKAGQVTKLKEASGRRRILTGEEEEKLIAEAERSTWPAMALFLRLALTTGARKSELQGLRWSDIDLTRRVAVLRHSKNGEQRTLPLVVSVRDALIEAKKVQPLNSDLVFFDHKNPEKPKNVDTIWKHVRARAGLEADRQDSLDRVVLHSTRHTATTKLIAGGANLIQAAAVTGHKTVGMLKRYAHMKTDDVLELADRLLEQRK